MAVPFTFLFFSYFVRLNHCKCLLLPLLLLPCSHSSTSSSCVMDNLLSATLLITYHIFCQVVTAAPTVLQCIFFKPIFRELIEALFSCTLQLVVSLLSYPAVHPEVHGGEKAAFSSFFFFYVYPSFLSSGGHKPFRDEHVKLLAANKEHLKRSWA